MEIVLREKNSIVRVPFFSQLFYLRSEWNFKDCINTFSYSNKQTRIKAGMLENVEIPYSNLNYFSIMLYELISCQTTHESILKTIGNACMVTTANFRQIYYIFNPSFGRAMENKPSEMLPSKNSLGRYGKQYRKDKDTLNETINQIC